MTEQLASNLNAKPIAITPQRNGAPRGAKRQVLIKLLSRRSGATVSQIQKKLDWKVHTIRGAISRLRTSGLTIELDKGGKHPRYRIVQAPSK